MDLRIVGWVRWVLMGILAVLLGVLVWANYQFVLDSPGGNDFLARWTGANLWLTEGVNPYDEQVSLTAQRMIYGRPANPAQGEDIAHFAYPLPAMLFFAPFGLIPFTLARALWMTILEIALPVLAVVSLQTARWKAPAPVVGLFILFSIFWYHGLRSIIVGQFAVVEALLIVAGLLLIIRESDTAAGVLLGLSIAKPQMAFLILPYIMIWAIRRRRFGLISSIVGTILGLLVLSVLLLPDWPLLWLRQLVSYPSYTALGSPISILFPGASGQTSLIIWIISGALLAYLFLEWGLSLSGTENHFYWTASLTLVITNIIAFRTATTNYVVMLGPLVLVFHAWAQRWGRSGYIAVWVVSLSLLGGLWGLFLLTVDGNIEAPIMYLPLPFLTLVGLLWSRWWILRASPKVRIGL